MLKGGSQEQRGREPEMHGAGAVRCKVQELGGTGGREVWDPRSYPLPSIRLDGLFKILAVDYVQISLRKIMQSYSFETLKTYFVKVSCRKATLNT